MIRSWRQVTVAAEVQGVIEKRYGKEGQLIKSGTVVFEISPDVFETLVERARERLAWQTAERREYEQELKLKEELNALDATTAREIVKARAAAQIAAHKENAAKLDLELVQPGGSCDPVFVCSHGTEWCGVDQWRSDRGASPPASHHCRCRL